ncbi:MAG: MarR family transcriptional regulator [Pseudomonadota bacterium]
MDDLVDQLIAEWGREAPELDVGGMAIVGRILALGRRFETRIETKLKPLGLIYTDFDILATLRRSGAPYDLTPTELRRSILLTSGAMTAALDRLERNGLIERIRSQKDRRSSSARLTQEGVNVVDEAAVMRFKDANESVDSLSEQDRETLARLLKKLFLAADGLPIGNI